MVGDPGAGEGGHGARPHQSVDAVWLAARVITELQQTIARRLDALQPVVISFGKVEGGRAFRVIADQLRCWARCAVWITQQHAQVPAWIDETVQGICASGGYGCCELPLHCTTGAQRSKLTTLLERCAVECLGRDKVLKVEQPSLGAEDFAELLQDVPGMMVRLGVAGPEGVRRCWRSVLTGGRRPRCWHCGSHGHRAGVDHGEHLVMNQRRAVIWVSLGAPFLILLALLATNQRQGKDRVQVLPAVLVGSGLIIGYLGRQRRRARLLADLRQARTRQQPMSETDPQHPDLEAVRQAIASGDPVKAMPAITQLRHCSDAEAVPLLVLGTEQKPFWCAP